MFDWATLLTMRQELERDADQLLIEIKRRCRPEFAERCEQHMRENNLLSPSNKGH
jgi:hypothetical protein